MRWLDILERDREGRLAFFPLGRRGYLIASPTRAKWIRIGYAVYFFAYVLVISHFISERRLVAGLVSVGAALGAFQLGAWLATRQLERTTSRLSYRERMRRRALLQPVWINWFYVCFGLLMVSVGLILVMQPWPRWLLGVAGAIFGLYLVVQMVWIIAVRTFEPRRNRAIENTGDRAG